MTPDKELTQDWIAEIVPDENGVDEWCLMNTYMDSGCAKSVCPLSFCEELPVRTSESSLKGEHFKTADGTQLRNQGERNVQGISEMGQAVQTAYAVAEVSLALDSVSQICDNGSIVVFNKYGGKIIGPGGKVDFVRKGDTYIRSTWVRRPRKASKKKDEKRDSEGDVEMGAVVAQGQTGTRPAFARQGAAHP